MVVVIAASVLLSWHALQRHGDARRQQATLVDATSRAAAREITLELQELRRSVRLLADAQQPRIQFLASHPDDQAAFQALNATVRAYFPEAFAVTLADAEGRELIDNFDDGIQDVCRQDMARFAGSGKPAAALIHPNPAGYHFDVTVPADLGGRQGVFFVSFHPELISRVLRHNELDGHHIYLVKPGDDRDLVEVGAQGSRDQLQRAFFLAPGERQRVVARTPVAGTQWDLVLVPNEGAFLFSKPAKDAAISIALLLSIGGLAAWWVRNAQRQVAQRDRQLRRQARELEHSEHRLRLLHETTSAANLGRAAKIDAVLKMGLQEFGLDLGIVSRIHGGRYEVLHTLSYDQRLGPGAEFPLGDTYCRHMLSTGDAVAIAHVGRSQWRSHPCYQAFKLESYIGAPILIDGETVGTLNFSSTEPRPEPFTERDLDLLRIMARWVGIEIERERAERRLRESETYLQSILDTVADAILTTNADGRITTWNHAATRMFEYEAAELEGRPIHALVPDIGPSNPCGDSLHFARRSDGQCFPTEVSINAMRGTGASHFTAVIRDVSARHRAEHALRLNHKLLQAVSEAQSRFIAEEGNTEVFDTLLQNLLALTDSRGGFIAEVWQCEPADPELEVYAATGEGDLDAQSLCRAVIAAQERVIDNDVDGARVGVPVYHGSQLLGMIGLSGRTAGYDEELTDFIEPLASTCGSLMQAYRSDRQLHESMQIQAAILRTTRYMVIATDPQGVIITFNEAAEQALGYCAEELVGTHTPAIFHDPDEIARRAVEISAQWGYEIEPGFETFVHTVRGGNVEERIWKYVRKDGTAFPVLLTVNALIDHNGEITGFLGVAKDITEQLAAEEVVRRSQARLAEAEQRSRLLLECAGDGIYGLDRRGRTVFVNPAAARMLGYEVEELIGTPMHKLVHHSHADGTPYAPKDCPMYAAFRDGQVQRVKDEVLWRKDGTCFPVEYTSTPIRNGGETVGAVVIFKDVTEARASELALRGSEARLAEAQRIAHLGSWEWNVRTHETYWSDETFRIFGYRPRSFEPDFARYSHHIHSDDRQRVIEALSKAAADGTPFECGYRIITTDGSERDVNDRGQCVVDATGNMERMVGIIQDVTEQRKVERMKNEFVSTVSHELRTPLTSIRGSLGLLSGYMTEALPEKARELVAIAQRNSERLLLLINDILDLSKIESGRLAFHMRELELDEFLRQAVLANQGYAEQYRVALVLEQPKQAVRIQADPDRLMQVMNNLLSNAVKFSPSGTQVRIRVGVHGDRVRIQVCDRGPGIPAAFQSRVFERFTQADASDTRELGGTGLGLSIAKAIVERHGGEIGFDTGSGGTTFHFDLAVAKSAASSDSPARGADMQTPARILVCEDDPDAARLIGLQLQQQGYEADFAHSATAARALLERHRYCALTLDILLPDGDGLQLLQELRRADATRALPVVVVSAVADEARRSLNGTALEVLDWLDKPIDHQRLTAALTRLSTHRAPRRPRVLHVEDDGDICEIVRLLLNEHADVDHASTISQARTALQRRHFDLILLDLELPDGSGLALLDDISAESPVTPAVVFSATELDETARAGVHACFVKSRTSDQELRDRLLASLPGTVSAGLRPCVETADP